MTTKHDITMIDEAELRLKDVRIPSLLFKLPTQYFEKCTKEF